MVLCLICFLFTNRCKTRSDQILNDAEKRECQLKMLQENFPLIFFAFVCLLDLVLGFAAIGFQVKAGQAEAPYYEIRTGIWVGIFKIIIESLCLLLIRYRRHRVYFITKGLHFLTTVFSLILIGVNLYAIVNTDETNPQYSAIWYNWVLLLIGIVSDVAIPIMEIVFKIRLEQTYKVFLSNESKQFD